jgi:uncharacterized membrane protein YraQ (UPF0718 family)
MFFLALSIVALAAGPLLARVAQTRPWAVDFADGFVVVAVGGLVVLHVIPASIEIGGAWALAAALCGLVAPLAFERFEQRAASSSAKTVIYSLVLIGVGVHALLDGAAMLELGGAPAARALAVSVVVHRIPVGLAIWWLVRPRRGLAAALTLLAVEAGGGIVGFLVGGSLLTGAFAPHLSLFQAALAGALLHVLAHHAPSPHEDEEGESHEHVHAYDEAHETEAHHRPPRFASGLGALAAIAFVAFITREHPVAHPALDELGARATFLSLTHAVALPLIAACTIAGIAHVILPQNMAHLLSKADGATGAMRGLVSGMLLPVCSCGIVPLHRTLRDRRLAPSAAAGLLVASPELGPAALLLSFALLGSALAVARICTAAVAAIVVAFLFTYATRDNALPSDLDSAPRLPASKTSDAIGHALRFGFVEMLDHTAPWLLAGLIAASLAEPTIPHDAFVSSSPILVVVVAALLGVPFYVSASAAMPVLAVLMHKGLSPGAVTAFLLTAPAVTPATVKLLAARFGMQTARIFAVAVVIVAIASGIAIDQFASVAFPFDVHRASSLLANLALPIFALLVVASLVRQGPRAMLAKLLSSG